MALFDCDDSFDELSENEGDIVVLSLDGILAAPNPLNITEVSISTSLDKLPVELCNLLNLVKLTVVNGNISLIENLDSLTKLEFLNLSSNMIPRIQNLDHNLSLRCLVLDYNPISCIQVEDLTHLTKLERLYLCGTMIDNLWMTAAALYKLQSLQELAFCKFDGQYAKKFMRPEDSLQEGENVEDRNEREAESILDLLARRIGDMTIEEIGGRINNLSGSLTSRLREANWPALERLSRQLGVSDLPQRVTRLGEQLDSEELTLFGERLQRLSIPATINYLNSLRQNISTLTGTGASSIGQLLNTIQTAINSDSSDFFLDDPSSSSDDEDIDFLNEDVAIEKENFSSPICWERNYTEFFIHNLPQIRVFDGIKIHKAFRERASEIYFSSFQDLQWTCSTRARCSSMESLMMRELGSTVGSNSPFSKRLDSRSFQNSICSSLISKYQQPKMTVLSSELHTPRQFEYHPSQPGILLYGTTTGDLVVINTNTQRVLSETFSRSPRPILGLCWFHKEEKHFIAGSDDGTLNIYNSGVENQRCSGRVSSVADLENCTNLTSLHINSTDQYCLASGFDPVVKLYDLHDGRLANSFKELHSRHINVLKFAHQDPNIFATSSFDGEVKLWDLRDMSSSVFTRKSNKGNVMVCFSPDDKYILSSAVDNEVRQYTTSGGRLHLNLNIKKTYSKYNYTRSYYMNDGEFIIVGSCQEGIVRVYNSSDGKFLRDVLLSYERSAEYYCQSLRADPFFPFTFSTLIASKLEFKPLELTEINLLQKPKAHLL